MQSKEKENTMNTVEQTESSINKYTVSMPATIQVTVNVLAHDESEAKDKARDLVEAAQKNMAHECIEEADVFYPPDTEYAMVEARE